jgi:hypothetical protein
MRRLVAFASLLLLAACASTRPIPPPKSIPIPASLTKQNVEVAIISALRTVPPPGSYDPRREMAPDDYETLVAFMTSSTNRAWVVEAREPGRVTAKIDRPQHRIRVAVTYDDTYARVELVDSEGLEQSGKGIHRKAVGWMLKLEKRIAQELDRMAFARQAGAPAPG